MQPEVYRGDLSSRTHNELLTVVARLRGSGMAYQLGFTGAGATQPVITVPPDADLSQYPRWVDGVRIEYCRVTPQRPSVL